MKQNRLKNDIAHTILYIRIRRIEKCIYNMSMRLFLMVIIIIVFFLLVVKVHKELGHHLEHI